jgi:predicted metalloenzyme YecM
MATSDPGIGTAVRYFLHYSNLASSFYKQYGSAKKVKDEYEQQIINTLRQSGMENATIQINGGQITVINKREPNQLSLSKIEELLHGYFRQKGGPDQSLDIMTFIRSNRGYTMNKNLKQSGIQQPHANPSQIQQLQ